MNIAGILGILGFGFALVLGVLEFYRYHRSLSVKIREVDLVGSSKDKFLVLLRVIFVNPATQGKTVYHLGVGVPNKEDVSQAPYEYGEDHDTLTYALPNTQNVNANLPLAETLLLPLDIPPHQSHSGWFVVVIQKEFEEIDNPKVLFVLEANDISGKTIAKFDKEIELRTHTIP